MKRRKCWFLGLVLFWVAFSGAACSSPSRGVSSVPASLGTELTLSVPVETTLSVPGVRSTKEVWLEMFQSARHSIDLEQFYISEQKGEALTPVLASIRAAAGRGVRVRIILDSKFLKTYPEQAASFSVVPNVAVRIIDYSKHGGVQHAKFFLIDGQSAFLGSPNFDWRALDHIHEVGIRFREPALAVRNLAAVFERDWQEAVQYGVSAGVNTPSIAAGAGTDPNSNLVTVASPPSATPQGIESSESALLKLLGRARKSIRIEVMDYSTKAEKSGTWNVLDQALRRAAQQGVHVQLMVNVSSLKKSGEALRALARIQGIEVRSVTIPPWSGGQIPFARLIHSKFVVVDEAEAWIGTENWSEGYFHNCRNVGVILSIKELVIQLDQIFQRLWGSSYSSVV